MSNPNDLNKLNDLLFETLDGVINKTKFEDKRVYAIVQLSNSIINNGKLQLAAYKLAKSEQTPQLFGLPEASQAASVQTPKIDFSNISVTEKESKEKRRLQTEKNRHASMMGFANEKGYKNVTEAMSEMTKAVFITQFENWMNAEN